MSGGKPIDYHVELSLQNQELPSPRDIKRHISDDSSATQWSSPDNRDKELSQATSRKRNSSTSFSRSPSPALDDEEDPNVDLTVGQRKTKTIRVGDKAALNAFYDNTFHSVQQLAIKSIMKAWIKVIDPNKQKQHPYTGGIPPPYWPEGIPHKEPDHIKKKGLSIQCVQMLKLF
jgi:hypothetical protein